MHVECALSQEARPRSKAPIRRVAAGVERLMRLVLLVLIRGYQVVIRPWLIGTCKFYPTCSEYGVEAIQTHGAVRGSLLAIRRVSRCRPFSMGGIDPVPEVISAPGEASIEGGEDDQLGVDAPVQIR